MAKKYLLHRITQEDADYISEETHININEFYNGNCYLLINKENGKIYKENDNLLIYKASGTNIPNALVIEDEKRRFLEAIEACAYFRGYANRNDIKFKTSKISELLYELEDHEIEIPQGCYHCKIVSTPRNRCNEEILNYMNQAYEGYDVLNRLQRNLPTLALFINEANPIQEEETEEELEEEIEDIAW